MTKSWEWWRALSFLAQRSAAPWLPLVIRSKVMNCKVFCGISLQERHSLKIHCLVSAASDLSWESTVLLGQR